MSKAWLDEFNAFFWVAILPHLEGNIVSLFVLSYAYLCFLTFWALLDQLSGLVRFISDLSGGTTTSSHSSFHADMVEVLQQRCVQDSNPFNLPWIRVFPINSFLFLTILASLTFPLGLGTSHWLLLPGYFVSLAVSFISFLTVPVRGIAT